MTQFDSTKMSDDEYSFIKLYCAAVKIDYPIIVTIRHLTDPDNLGVTNIIDAAEMALKLQAMQRTFCATIESMGSPVKRPLKKGEKSDEVTNTQVAAVFTQSFFKLIDSTTKKAIVSNATGPMHDGWSSGHPLQWQQVIKSLNDMQAHKQYKNFGSSGIISALLNLLSILPKNKHEWHEYEEEDDEWDEDGWDQDDDYFS